MKSPVKPTLSLLGACLLLTACTLTQPSAHRDGEKLAELMIERLDWMDEVAAIKQIRRLPVADPGREAELLAAMEQRGLSVSEGVPKSATRAFFTGQIAAAKEFQAEWLQQHPRPQPRNLPDLAKTVRPALDRIGAEMLTHVGNISAVHADANAMVEIARQHLTRAGYSQAVIQPSLQGLQAALTP